MNPIASRAARGLLLSLLPVVALAGSRNDYAREWPLTASEAEVGAYRVVLDEAIYRQVQSSGLRDLEVFDARGRPVPAALFDPVRAEVAPARLEALPWFPLPAMTGPASRDIAAISEIATDGSLRRVELRGTDARDGGILIDASRLASAPIALRIHWTAGQAPFDRAYQVLASDNLRDWRSVQDEAHLVELENQGQRVVRDRIEVATAKARYLRLAPLTANPALRLERIEAELARTGSEPAWAWQELPATRGEDPNGAVHYEFSLPGRFPIERVDVRLPGNSTQSWTLESRDATTAPWRRAAAPWVAYRLQSGGRTDASPPQALDGMRRDRHWRLTAARGVAVEAPRLRLGYRPETLVFVAQGEAPFTLAAGSARTRRDDAPLAELVAALRQQHGPAWQPALATLGPARVVAGDAALTPAPPQRDWKAWLLWGLLVAGALLVAGFAFSLLRKPPSAA
ncbi:DUF3999 domain-containing protein [Pseudoxanthomonas beigongshangi]